LDKASLSLIKGYLQRSEEKLKSAHDLFDSKDWGDSVSRAYYCAFHAAQALLFSEGLSARTHRGIFNLFGLHFIKEGRFDKKFARILKNLRDDRESGDYEVFSVIDEETAENALKEAEEFLNEAKRYLARYL
jgi:uncharacterized protein (UPF0332 family)